MDTNEHEFKARIYFLKWISVVRCPFARKVFERWAACHAGVYWRGYLRFVEFGCGFPMSCKLQVILEDGPRSGRKQGQT